MLNNPIVFFKLPSTLAHRGVKKSKHYDDIKNGLFTRPVKTGKRGSAWPAHEVAAINQAILAGKSEEEIKKLVAKLEAARTVSTEA
ncbi:MAG: helix-turn-helix transcriptional regulator [Methylobacter sp.]